ncbi:MAG: phosphatidylglycerophosphatase A [Gemmatimonadota bacterium]|nr:phosphatidylglycerophosphatase A [Gemmatimonadota bacterium]
MTDFRPSEPSFFVRLIATGFFSGYSSFAPGTAGSGVALVIYCLLPPLNSWAWGLLLVGLFCAGVYTSGACEKAWGKDPRYVVIDEFAGFFVTVSLFPQSVLMGIVGFVVFRILDITKPPPARQVEALPGGWGIVGDDVIVGIYGQMILWLAFSLLPL